MNYNLNKKLNRPTTAKSRITNISFNLSGPKSQILEQDEEGSNFLKNSMSHIKKTDQSYVEELKNTTTQNDHQEEINKMLLEENKQVKFLSSQREKIKDIELLENIEGDLYKWDSLFSKSRPISAYTCSGLKHRTLNAESDNSNNLVSKDKLNSKPKEKDVKKIQSKEFIFPVALIDEKEEVISDFIKIHKNLSAKRKKMEEALKITQKNRKKRSRSTVSLSQNEIKNLNSTLNTTNNQKFREKSARTLAARPQSVYAERNDSDVFYLDKAFSTYFTQDESEFASKFVLLHPKIRCRKKKLRNTILETKISSMLHDKVVKKNKEENNYSNVNLKVDNKQLHLAGNSKNPIPLLKSIYKQIYPENKEEPLKSNKNYWISNKPLGNNEFFINFKNNVRNAKMQEFYKDYYKRIESERNPINNIEQYDMKDPDIQIFVDNEKDLGSHDLLNYDEDIIPEHTEEHKDHLEQFEKVEQLLVDTDESNKKLQSVKINFKDNIHYTRPQTAFNKHNSTKLNLKTKPATARLKVSKGTSISNEKIERSITKSPRNEEKIYLRDADTQNKDSVKRESPIFYNKKVNETNYNKNYNKFLKTTAHKFKPRLIETAKNMQIKKKNELFEDVFVVKNINREVKEEIFSKLKKEDFKPRPNTGFGGMEMRKPRPLSTFYKKNERKDKKSPPVNKNINNIYFNKYIDIQFSNVGSFPKILL